LLPQWRLVGTAVASLSIMWWGWWNLRRERNTWLGACAFLAGCILWGYSMNLIMRWWVGV
jgi:hypothetical protein